MIGGARWVEGRADDDAGKLSVHGNERVAINKAVDETEFVVEIEVPDLADMDGGREMLD